MLKYRMYLYVFRAGEYLKDFEKFIKQGFTGNRKVEKRARNRFNRVVKKKIVINQQNRPYRRPVKGKTYKAK